MIAKKRILPMLVAVLMVLAMMPVGTGKISAESASPALNLGTDVLAKNANTSNAQIVWYADNTWFVIAYNGSAAASENDAATLLSVDNIDLIGFDENNPRSNFYDGSSLQTAINTFAGDLTKEEKEAVVKRTLVHGEYDGDDTDCIAGNADIENVFLWPLSIKEALSLNNDLRTVDANHSAFGHNTYWWLRSPGYNNNTAVDVDEDGYVNKTGSSVSEYAGMRPAFYLDLESVLLTTAAENGKSSDTTGADALKAQSDLINSGSEWKVTLKDNAHTGFTISKATPTENSVSVKYTGASTGTNEYISAIITDKPMTEDDAAIKYYGRIKNCTSDDDVSGTVTISTANKLGENDYLYVFNEQCNGDKKTDYASELTEVTITEPTRIIIPTGKTLIYNGKTQTGVAAGTGYTLSGTTSAAKAGSYKATAVLKDGYIWSDGTNATKTISWKINKAANPLKISPKSAQVKFSKLKKNNQTLAVTKVIKFTKQLKDKKTYTLSSAKKGKKSFKKYFKINKTTGKVTVKKGLKKGTYKVKVKVKALGNSNYKASTVKTVTFTVKVK